jgi:hypothetical protein
MAHRVSFDRVVNTVLVVAAVLVGTNAIRQLIGSASPQPPLPTYESGEAVPALRGISYGDASKTVLLFLNSNCPACSASVPAYRRLIARKSTAGEPIRILALGVEPQRTLQEYLARNEVVVDAVATVNAAEWYKVRSTPTVLLVGRDGAVSHSWVGMLQPDSEEALTRVLFGSTT